MIEAISGLSAAFGLAGSAGLNAYIPLLMVALAARFPLDNPLIKLQAPYDLLGSWWAIGLIACLLYTSPSPRDRTRSRMPSSA